MTGQNLANPRNVLLNGIAAAQPYAAQADALYHEFTATNERIQYMNVVKDTAFKGWFISFEKFNAANRITKLNALMVVCEYATILTAVMTLLLLSSNWYFLFAIATIALIVAYIKLRRQNAEKLKTDAELLIAEQQNLSQEQYEGICRALNEYHTRYGVIPNRYLNPYALQFIGTAIANMRADTMKEAYNLYEQHLQHQQMLLQNQQQFQQLYQQQQAMFARYESNRNTDNALSALAFAALLIR